MPEPSDFVIPARIVASASFVVALGVGATLVIVVSNNHVDILATVALALAILAFVVQLIVYVVQSASASQQLADARSLHGEMMAVLAEVQERSVGTQRSIDQMQSQMLTELSMKAYGTTENQESATPSSYIHLGDTFRDATELPAAATRAPVPNRQNSIEFPPSLDGSVSSAIRNELLQWPSTDEIQEIEQQIVTMRPDLVHELARLSRDALSFSQPGMSYSPGIPIDDDTRELIELGLAEKIPGWRLATLTPDGRKLGRIFTADPPTGTPASILRIREESTPKGLPSYRE